MVRILVTLLVVLVVGAAGFTAWAATAPVPKAEPTVSAPCTPPPAPPTHGGQQFAFTTYSC